MPKYYYKVKLTIYNLVIFIGAFFDFYIFKKSLKRLATINTKKSDSILILGTGPSLKSLNQDILRQVDTLSVNGYASLVKDHRWFETDFYMVQDVEVYQRLKSSIDSFEKSNIFFSSLLKFSGIASNKLIKNGFCYRHHMLNHAYVDEYKNLNYKLSKMEGCLLYDGYTVIYSSIQIAIAMGYKNIYLLGVDANYSKDINQRNIINIGKVDPTFASAGERIIKGIKFLVKNYPEIKIYNCSESGSLNFLEYKNKIDGYQISN